MKLKRLCTAKRSYLIQGLVLGTQTHHPWQQSLFLTPSWRESETDKGISDYQVSEHHHASVSMAEAVERMAMEGVFYTEDNIIVRQNQTVPEIYVGNNSLLYDIWAYFCPINKQKSLSTSGGFPIFSF